MDVSEVLSYIGSAIGVIVAIASFIVARARASVTDTRELEHRLTQLETNQFTKEDRQCLRDNDLKMKLFWGVVEKEFPKLLKQHRTPMVDKLLTKAAMGLDKLTPNETSKLMKALDNEFNIAVSQKNPRRALMIAFYLKVMEFKNGIRLSRACV
jgi:hypothetical protein